MCEKMGVSIFFFFSFCLIDKVKKKKKTVHINNIDKLVDKFISFHLMCGLTGFYGFLVI